MVSPCKVLATTVPTGCTACTNPCDTPFVMEESLEKGAAAVMRMILGSERVGFRPPPSQTVLYDQAKLHNGEGLPNWYVDPKGMRDTLNDNRPAAFMPNYFIISAAANRDVINEAITYTVDHYEVAPAVLINEGKQWVAVVGYRLNANGQLQAFYVNDPHYPPNQGGRLLVTAQTWNSVPYWFLSPVPTASSPTWGANFVTVRDPRPPGEPLPSAVPEPRADGSEIISSERATEFARQILEEEGLVDDELYARVLEVGRPTRPHLVQRLDGPDLFYYLIRFQHEGRDLAAVALDARFGVLLESIAYPEPVRFFIVDRPDIPEVLAEGIPTRPPIEEVRDRILGRFLESYMARRDPRIQLRFARMLDLELAHLVEPRERMSFRAEELSIHPLMAWHPCGDAASLLFPSYIVHTPRKTLYVRAADGRISTEDDCRPFDPYVLGG